MLKKGLLSLLLSCSLIPYVSAENFVFGLVPQQSAAKLAEAWTPIFSYLSEKTGDTYSFATAPDIPTFEQRVMQGEYDLAYMNPYHYTVFSQGAGYRAFAKQRDIQIIGLLVAHKDSQINELSDLDGLQVAFPSPAAFAATILPRAEFRRQKINITPKFVSSHDSVYLNVAKGFFPAGGGITRTLNNFDPELRSQLKVLWRSNPFTPHAFAYKPTVDVAAVERLTQAMIAMSNDEKGASLLKFIGFSGIDAANDAEWDDVRELDIEALDNMLAK